MKSCPICNRTFEDTFTFCLADGTLLSAPFDPKATLVLPELDKKEPPPTLVMPPLEELREEIPPTVYSPNQQQKSEELPSKLLAPHENDSAKVKISSAQAVPKSNRLAWIIASLAILALTGFLLFSFGNSGNDTVQNPDKTKDAQTTPTNASVTQSIADTVWQSTKKDDELSFIVEFNRDGTAVNRTVKTEERGTWKQVGNDVSTSFPNVSGSYSYSSYGTINGNVMTGYTVYSDKPNDKSYWTMQRIR